MLVKECSSITSVRLGGGICNGGKTDVALLTEGNNQKYFGLVTTTLYILELQGNILQLYKKLQIKKFFYQID